MALFGRNKTTVGLDIGSGLIKVAVIERHGVNGNIGLGFVHGFGILSGAIGSTVGHDCHNITVVGMSDTDMALAANRLREIKGGFVVVRDGNVVAELPLLAKRAGAVVIDVNPQCNPISEIADIFLQGAGGVILPQVMESVIDFHASKTSRAQS